MTSTVSQSSAERLQAALPDHPDGLAAAVIEAVEQNLSAFAEGVTSFDNVTMVVAKPSKVTKNPVCPVWQTRCRASRW